MKHTLLHIVDDEKNIFDKKIGKSDMTTVNLAKSIEYLKIEETL